MRFSRCQARSFYLTSAYRRIRASLFSVNTSHSRFEQISMHLLTLYIKHAPSQTAPHLAFMKSQKTHKPMSDKQWHRRLSAYASGAFKFHRGQRPAKETRWGKVLNKIEKCAQDGTKDVLGRPVTCTCGYHLIKKNKVALIIPNRLNSYGIKIFYRPFPLFRHHLPLALMLTTPPPPLVNLTISPHLQ